MTQISTSQDESVFPPLPCGAIVYRAVLRGGWIDKRNNQVKSVAFLRRPPDSERDQKGMALR